jgi:hypothetical protein
MPTDKLPRALRCASYRSTRLPPTHSFECRSLHTNSHTNRPRIYSRFVSKCGSWLLHYLQLTFDSWLDCLTLSSISLSLSLSLLGKSVCAIFQTTKDLNPTDRKRALSLLHTQGLLSACLCRSTGRRGKHSWKSGHLSRIGVSLLTRRVSSLQSSKDLCSGDKSKSKAHFVLSVINYSCRPNMEMFGGAC